MSDAFSQPVVFKGSLGEALKVIAWLGVAELFATMNSGWPQGVMLALGLLIAFAPAISAELRAVLITAMVVAVTVAFAPLGLEQRFWLATTIYAVTAAGVLAARLLGGTQLRLDRTGATVSQYWARRRLAWDKVRPQVLMDISGRPIAAALQPADGAPFYLPEHYGMTAAELASLMDQFRGRAVDAG